MKQWKFQKQSSKRTFHSKSIMAFAVSSLCLVLFGCIKSCDLNQFCSKPLLMKLLFWHYIYDLPLLLFWTLSALLHSLYKRNLSRIPCKVIRNALGAPSSTLSPKAVGSSGSLNLSPDNQLEWGTTSGEPQQMFFNSLKFS